MLEHMAGNHGHASRKKGLALSHTSRIQTTRRDNISSTRATGVSKFFVRWPSIPTLIFRDESREARLEAEVETLRNIIQAKEKEVQCLKESNAANTDLEREPQNLKREEKDGILELEKLLNDSNIANSGLELELGKSKREKTTLDHKYQDLDHKHREALTQLKEVEATGEKYRATLDETRKRASDLHAQCKHLQEKNREITAKNRDQDREIKTLVAQLNKFTGDIARQTQRVNTSAIRDDEYFAREFADLSKDIRSWSFTHFFHHTETFVPKVVTGALLDAIGRIATGTSLPGIFKNRVTSRRVVAALFADELRYQLFDSLVLGLLPEVFRELESVAEKTGCRKSPWLSQTISLFVRSEKFKWGLGERVRTLTKNLNEMLGGLADESKALKRGQRLQTIVERAANLAVEVSQQPYWYRLSTITPGDSFVPYYMEDVETEVSLGGDPNSCKADCTVSLSIFPCVYRQERIEGRGKPENLIINRAWVTVEAGDDRTATEQEGGGETKNDPGGGVEVGGCPSGQLEDGGDMGAQGEGSEDSPDSKMLATEKGILPGLISSELQEGVSIN